MRAFLASTLGRLVMFIVCYAVAFGIVFGVAALASSMDIPLLMLIVLVPIIICGWHFIDCLRRRCLYGCLGQAGQSIS